LTVYFISGLGADSRAFENIVLPEGFIIKHIHWIEPERNEGLQQYCRRLSAQIDSSDPFVLAGLSFGGIAAIEMNRFLQPLHTVLISTIALDSEMPASFRLLRHTGIYKWVSPRLLKRPNPITFWLFSAKTAREKELIRDFLRQVTPNYLRWSIHVILNWKNTFRPKNLSHIHGTRDRIFPVGLTGADYRIRGGGHFMLHDKGAEISGLLGEILLSLRA